MKRQITKVMTVFVILVVAAIGTAAHGASKIVVNIPFDFFVGDKNVPAGEYTITKISSASDRLVLVRSTDGKVAVMLATNSVQSGSESNVARLNFRRFDEQYFLVQIWSPGNREGYEVSKSRRQKSLELEAAKLRNTGGDEVSNLGETVTITGSVK